MKKNGKKLLIFLILILVIVAVVFTIVKVSNKELKLQSITEADVKYYVLKKDNKFGVIDKNGNIVIEPKYAEVIIPNPTKEVFLYAEDESINNTNYKAIKEDGSQIFTDDDNVQAISINQLTSYVPYEKSVLIYQKGQYFGLMNFDGKKVTDAVYEEISSINYKEGYLKVKKNGSYGVINIEGKTIIKADYDDIYSDGYYNEKTKYSKAGFILRVKTDSGYKYGYANYNGKVLHDTMYNDVNRINDVNDDKNAYVLLSMNGKYSLAKNKKIILNSEFDDIYYDNSSKLLVVQNSNGQGVYNLDGKNIIPIDYDLITIGGDYINASKENNKLVFDLTGNKIETNYYSHNKVSDQYSIIIDNDNNYNITDSSNKELLKDNYVYIEYFTNNLFIATKDTKTGIIDGRGNIIVPIKYATIQKISDTDILEATLAEDNEVDLINTSGSVIKGIKNATVEKYDNYIKMYSDSDVKYFDLTGSETSYKNLFPSNKIFADNKNGKWGFVDATGKVVVNYQYDFVTEQFGNYVGVKKSGKWGVLLTDGKTVLTPSYSFDMNNVRFLSQYYEVRNNLGVPMFSGDVEE